MKSHFLLFLVCIFACSCNDEAAPHTVCAVENPSEDLDWLASEIEVMKTSDMLQYLYISQAEYNGMTVFLYGNCCPFCLTITPVYNCAGEHIGNIGDGNLDPSLLDHAVVIWKPENSSCNFK